MVTDEMVPSGVEGNVIQQGIPDDQPEVLATDQKGEDS